METYAVKLCAELALRCALETRVLPGRPDGSPPGLIRLASFVVKAMHFLVGRRADVVHVGDLVLWPLALAARLARTAPRIAITAYGLDLVFGRRPGLLPWIYRRYLALGVRLVGKNVRVIAISRQTATLCREAGFRDVAVVTLGVDLPTRVPPVDRPAGDFVLFIGRLVRRKGAAWFAREVMPLLPGTLRLVVVGRAWDEEEAAALRTDPRVDCRDVVSAADLFTLRRDALAVVMPNITSGGTDVEGFGLTAVEAGADGGVLLASGIEGILDAVVDGRTGFLLPTGDASAWAAKIAEIATWPAAQRTSFILAAQETIASLYAWPAVAERTLEAYGAPMEAGC
ncbi:glycosyltransferase family 4 protein [Dyella halodurans]|uniref:Glycosyltransferase family 4 protein n=1 Tax=Dyella halodurans TaxID=1920171 RepID=A0ABV9BX29_9GAMM|nr:glycosyltransferase family 4 protein [Dyella halodurans]